MTPEGRVKAKLKARLKAVGAYQFWPVQMGYGAATVDCLAAAFGRFVGIECKREGVEKPTPRQARVMEQIRAAGGLTYLVTMENEKLKWIEVK